MLRTNSVRSAVQALGVVQGWYSTWNGMGRLGRLEGRENTQGYDMYLEEEAFVGRAEEYVSHAEGEVTDFEACSLGMGMSKNLVPNKRASTFGCWSVSERRIKATAIQRR